jgi:hypothetical protein
MTRANPFQPKERCTSSAARRFVLLVKDKTKFARTSPAPRKNDGDPFNVGTPARRREAMSPAAAEADCSTQLGRRHPRRRDFEMWAIETASF